MGSSGLAFYPSIHEEFKKAVRKGVLAPGSFYTLSLPAIKKAVVLTGFVPGYSGGSATVLHRFPSHRTALFTMMLAETGGLSIDNLPHSGQLMTIQPLRRWVKKISQFLEVFLSDLVPLSRFSGSQLMAFGFHFIESMIGQKGGNDVIIGAKDSQDVYC
jgi:hypothetical protein